VLQMTFAGFILCRMAFPNFGQKTAWEVEWQVYFYYYFWPEAIPGGRRYALTSSVIAAWRRFFMLRTW